MKTPRRREPCPSYPCASRSTTAPGTATQFSPDGETSMKTDTQLQLDVTAEPKRECATKSCMRPGRLCPGRAARRAPDPRAAMPSASGGASIQRRVSYRNGRRKHYEQSLERLIPLPGHRKPRIGAPHALLRRVTACLSPLYAMAGRTVSLEFPGSMRCQVRIRAGEIRLVRVPSPTPLTFVPYATVIAAGG
jgi:hypothetical protein